MKRWQENIIGWIIGVFTLGFYRYVEVSTHHEIINRWRHPGCSPFILIGLSKFNFAPDDYKLSIHILGIEIAAYFTYN